MNRVNIVVVYLLSFCLSVRAQVAGTLLVANKADNTVSLINLKNYQVAATIAVDHGPHEIATNPTGKLAAVANYGDQSIVSNSISIIDVAKLQKIKTIDLGRYQRPHGIRFINEEELIVTCEVKNVLLKINVSTGDIKEVANTAQQGSHMVAYCSKDQRAYIANVFSGTVSIIDVNANKLVTVVNFKAGIEGLDVSPDGSELWVANRNDSNVTVMNTAGNQKHAVLRTHNLPFRVKFTPSGKFVAVSNGLSGNVSMYDAKEKRLIRDIDVTAEPGTDAVPVGIDVNVNGKYFYVCTSGYNQVAVLDIQNGMLLKRIDTGKEPDGIAFSKVELK